MFNTFLHFLRTMTSISLDIVVHNVIALKLLESVVPLTLGIGVITPYSILYGE